MRTETRRFFRSALVLLLVAAAMVRPEHIGMGEGVLPSRMLPGLVLDVLTVVWWYALAWTVAGGLELFVWSRLFGSGADGVPRQRKLLTDVAHVLLYVVATAVVAVKVFDQPPTGIFATSGILVIVVGLALQSTLADLFSGLALNLERPFKAGDWITLDNGVQGLVLVTNWRATHIRTRSADELVVPNAVIARGRLTNHMRPTRTHLASVEVPLRFGFDETAVADLLKATAAGVPGVLPDPAPLVLMHEMRADAVVWRVFVYVDDFARLAVIRGEVTRALYAALRTGPAGDFLPRQHVWLHPVDAPDQAPRPADG